MSSGATWSEIGWLRDALKPRLCRVVFACLVASCLLFGMSSAVNEQKFRTCKNTAFCSRNRGRAATSYVVLADSVAQSEAGITFDLAAPSLSAEEFPAPLKASLTLLAAGSVRLRAEESDVVTGPKGKRWESAPGDVLVATALTPADGTVLKRSAEAATLCSADGVLCATLQFSPFRVELARAGTTAVVVNGDGLFHFEQRRERLPSDAAEAWSERHDGWTDNKKFGPTAISFDVAFPLARAVYGLPEHATSLALPHTRGPGARYDEPYRLFNLDVFEHKLDSPMALYGAVPLAVAHGLVPGADGAPARPLTAGAFWPNPSEMFVDVYAGARGGEATHWIAETGVVDLFLFAADAPTTVATQYALLTGTQAMPPRFALGYHQCRWNYKSEEDLLAVNAGFEEHDMPVDVLWLDIEHTEGKRYFTWDARLFPSPAEMQDELARFGRQLVTIVDPHVKEDDAYGVYKELKSKDLLTRAADGEVFKGDCWPGRSVYPDFLRADVRAAWAAQYSPTTYPGTTPYLHIWNDMNEPSVFSGPEVTMPKDTRHFDKTVEHREVHNLYGLMYHRANAEGVAARQAGLLPSSPATVLPDWAPASAASVSSMPGAAMPAHRPFVLTRAFFSSTQRVGAVWTGDNAATWEFLEATGPMLLGLSVGGISFSGADVGGFFGNPSVELLERWYQSTALTPFFRAHAHIETKRREPWLFGEPHTSRIRAALRQRYVHLAYLYTQMRLANTTGVPPMRPLVYQFPGDPETFARDRAYLIGDAVMVVPVTAAGKTSVEAYLPIAMDAAGTRVRSRWFDSATFAPVSAPLEGTGVVVLGAPADYAPVLYRGGAVIPLQRRPRRSSNAMTLDPFSMVVALDSDLAAAGSLYLDDGASMAFLDGHYVNVAFAAAVADSTFTFTSARAALPAAVPTAASLDAAVAANDVESLTVLGLPAGHSLANARVQLAGGAAVAAEVFNDAQRGVVVVRVRVPVSVAFTVSADVVAVI